MKKTIKILLPILFLVLCTPAAFASPFPGSIPPPVWDNDGTPDIYQAINQLTGQSYTGNDQVMDRFVEDDYLWEQLSAGPVLIIGYTAGNSNTLGFYTDPGVGSSKTAVTGPVSGFGYAGAGTIGDPYPADLLNVPSNPYGWYLDSVRGETTNTFYSQPELNGDGYDHMMTFELFELAGDSVYVEGPEGAVRNYVFANPYLIAWEDILGGGDGDYDDMMFVIDKVKPVPEPGTMLLLGFGLVGLAATIGRKRLHKKA